MEDLIKDVVPIYQKHLSRSDVEAVIRFYSSPVGQKIRREQPAMARESLQATAAGQRGKMELLLAKLDLRIEQLTEAKRRRPRPSRKSNRGQERCDRQDRRAAAFFPFAGGSAYQVPPWIFHNPAD